MGDATKKDSTTHTGRDAATAEAKKEAASEAAKT